MVRVVTQILLGLMLLFGTITLTPRMLYHVRRRNLPRALYLFFLWGVSLVFALAAFYYAYVGMRG